MPLRSVGEIALPGDNSGFDYYSLDRQRGLLFIAHLVASDVVEVDVYAGRVVRTIPNLAHVHGWWRSGQRSLVEWVLAP